MEKSIRKKYLNLALPSGFECIVGVLITMTDTFMISQFGSNIIAAVGAMGTVIDFMYLILQSINVSNNVIVARMLGKNDKEQIKISTGIALFFAILSSVLCIIITLIISKFIPKIFLIDKVGLIYLYIRLVGIIPNTISTILSGYQRTLGKSKRMLDIRILSFIINALLDFILIKLNFKIAGVAIATVIVEFLNMIILIYYSKNNVKFRFNIELIKEQFRLIKYNIYDRIFKRGSNFILNVIVSRLGSLQYAAHLVVTKFLDLLNNFLHGNGIGTQTMVSTAIGSEDKKKINKTNKIIKNINKKIIYIFTLIITIILLVSLPYFLIEKGSLTIGYKLVIFVIIDCILNGFFHYYSSVLRAMKEFKFISKLSFFINGILKVTLAILLSKLWGIYGIWLCFIISDSITNLLLNKKTKKLVS